MLLLKCLLKMLNPGFLVNAFTLCKYVMLVVWSTQLNEGLFVHVLTLLLRGGSHGWSMDIIM